MSDNSVDNQKQSTLWQSMMRRKQISTMIVKNDELAKNARESMPSNVSDTSGVATAAGATPADHTTTNTTTALTNTTNATTTIVNQTYQRYLSAATVYDLTGVGLSATLAIAVFLMVGYVAKSVAGPSVIISIIIAALIAFLAGNKLFFIFILSANDVSYFRDKCHIYFIIDFYFPIKFLHFAYLFLFCFVISHVVVILIEIT